MTGIPTAAGLRDQQRRQLIRRAFPTEVGQVAVVRVQDRILVVAGT